MRYHYEKPHYHKALYGRTYSCDHPLYNTCTLFEMEDKGLAVIQQRFDEERKVTWWGEIDSWLRNPLYINPCFVRYFRERAGVCTDGLYPTVTIRQMMWAFKMKPIARQRWETVFDRKDI